MGSPTTGEASQTGGVRPMDLGGRLVRERERLVGMTDAERAYRRQYLLDQRIAPHEPVFVPELYRATVNPIRRFYRAPLDFVAERLAPVIGNRAYTLRYFAGKIALGILGVYATAYYFKYNGNDWTRKGGWKVTASRIQVLPGEPGYPALPEKTKPTDFGLRGFDKSPI